MCCRICKKEFDPSIDFVEEVELLEALMYFTGEDEISNWCRDCTYELSDKIVKIIQGSTQRTNK